MTIMTRFMARRYQSGWRWCMLRWTDVVLNGTTYLRRLHLVQTPWFSVMLHWILTPDPQPDMHDHPVTFWSFVLRGWYTERVPASVDGLAVWAYSSYEALRSVNRKLATDQHRIIAVAPDTLTLVFTGPVVRSWGFHTPHGWVGWREYSKQTR